MVRCMFFRFAAMAIFSFSPLSRAVLIRVMSLLTRVSPKPGWPLMKFGRHAEFSRPCRQTLNITGLEGRLFTFPLAARRGLIACPVRVQSPPNTGHLTCACCSTSQLSTGHRTGLTCFPVHSRSVWPNKDHYRPPVCQSSFTTYLVIENRLEWRNFGLLCTSVGNRWSLLHAHFAFVRQTRSQLQGLAITRDSRPNAHTKDKHS